MTEDELRRVMPQDEFLETNLGFITDAMKDVRAFVEFDRAISLGLSIGLNDIPFERLMVFGWIKELRDVRKT